MRSTLHLALILLCGFVSAARAQTTEPSDEITTVRRADMPLAVDAQAWFAPIDPAEVRVRTKSYAGDLKVTSVAAHGASVRQGESLLTIDPTDIQRQIAAAQNEYSSAKANFVKAEADARLGREADELALSIQSAAEADAAAAVEWFEKVDGPHILRVAELQVRGSQNNLDDHNDELDQLRKMYKSEQLTNATADIVVKRKVRDAELAEIMLQMAKDEAEKTRATTYEQQKRAVQNALKQQQQATEALRVAQTHGRAGRESAVFAARVAAEAAGRKLEELNNDLAALTIVAPRDGMVLYGQLKAGSWSNNASDAIRVGEKITADAVLMTLVDPGQVRLIASVPENQISRLSLGQSASITPRAVPEHRSSGKLTRISPAATTGGDPAMHDVQIEIESADGKTLPGFHADVSIDIDDANGALLVPATAIAGGKVQVVAEDGSAREVEIVAARTDGKKVEVIRGLKEGDRVRTTFKKD